MDHSIANCPRRRLIQPMWSCAWAAVCIGGLAKGEIGRVVPYGDLGGGRTVFLAWYPLRTTIAPEGVIGAILKMHVGVRADKHVTGCLWIMSTAGA